MRQIPRLIAPAAIGAAVALYAAPPGSSAAASFEACVEQPSRQCLLTVAGAAAARTRLPATRAYLFTLIADAHAAAGAVADAKRAVDAAVDAIVEIDDPEARLSALSSVAERYRALGSNAAAEAALAEAAGLLGDGLAGDAGDQAFSRLMRMWHLAAPLAALGPSDAFATTMERAIRAAETVTEPGPRSNALVLIADLQAKLDPAAANGTFRHAIDAAADIASPADRAAALSAVSVAALQAGAERRALNTAKATLDAAGQVEDPSERARLTAIVILQLATFGDFPIGESDERGVAACVADPTRGCLVHHAAAAARATVPDRDRAVLLIYVAKARGASGGDPDTALADLAAALAAAEAVPVPRGRSVLLRDIARQQDALGDRPAARRTLAQLTRLTPTEAVEDAGINLLARIRRLTAVAALTAELDDPAAPARFQEVAALAETAENAWRQASALREVAVRQAPSDRTGAAETFARAVDAAIGVEFAESRANLLLEIADAAIEAGLPGVARTVTPDVLSAIRRLDGLTDAAAYRAGLALMLLKAGQG